MLLIEPRRSNADKTVFGTSGCLEQKTGKTKRAPRGALLVHSGGELGIRTPDTLLGYTHLAGELLRPLGQLSVKRVQNILPDTRRYCKKRTRRVLFLSYNQAVTKTYPVTGSR